MIQDPYSVLGVSPDATDDEIKTAYRRLAKKYHPDLNPGDETAAQKMNEVNAAYDQIKNPQSYKTGVGGQSYGGYDPFGGFGGYSQSSQSQSERTEYQAAWHFINYRRYQDALNTLSQVAAAERDAHWYYLSALAHSGLGNRMTAMEHMEKAADMEPDNLQYQSALQNMRSGGAAYQNFGSGFSMSSSPISKLCMGLCLLNFCCGNRFLFC